MTEAPERQARFLVALASTLLLSVVLTACGTGASVPATGAPIETTPPSSAAPSGSGAPGGDFGPGGSDALVVPKPGQLEVHPIAADSFSARVDGRHVILTITYTSGVEPCSVLDTIIVERGKGSVAITLREGHGPGNQVCIMIAKVMRTQVDLGELDSGTYTITDTAGGADPIQVVVG
jgi:hypothetical protein